VAGGIWSQFLLEDGNTIIREFVYGSYPGNSRHQISVSSNTLRWYGHVPYLKELISCVAVFRLTYLLNHSRDIPSISRNRYAVLSFPLSICPSSDREMLLSIIPVHMINMRLICNHWYHFIAAQSYLEAVFT